MNHIGACGHSFGGATAMKVSVSQKIATLEIFKIFLRWSKMMKESSVPSVTTVGCFHYQNLIDLSQQTNLSYLSTAICIKYPNFTRNNFFIKISVERKFNLDVKYLPKLDYWRVFTNS